MCHPLTRVTLVSFAGEVSDGDVENRTAAPSPEEYLAGEVALRVVTTRDGRAVAAQSPSVAEPRTGRGPYEDFWRAWLVGDRKQPNPVGATVSVADLFSGCGGLSVGIEEACRALGLNAETALAIDNDEAAMKVFEANFRPHHAHVGGIEELVDGDLEAPLTIEEQRLHDMIGPIDLAVGGPPCQGHSDLNNHTRRNDPKNKLYLRMVRFVEVIRPRHVIIENVPGVVHDRTGVVEVARRRLRDIGYTISDGVVAADALGWAQRRRRHLLLASLDVDHLDVAEVRESYARPALPVSWALDGAPVGDSVLDTSANHSVVNRRRIKYLFDNDVYELPDEERPDCHRLKPHSYRSVYGRMKPDEPAPTITSGFGSTGQGRFVHPTLPRTLTPREAARVQGFPDWFDFGMIEGRRALQEMIGNAVPSRLAYVAALELLR